MAEFKRKTLVTRNTFKFEVEKPLFLKIVGPMHVGQQRVGRDGKKSDKEPPTLINVINLETGEEGQVILSAVLKLEISENYPNDTYVGKCFEICKQKRKEGKQYDPYFIAEIEAPDVGKETASEDEAPAKEEKSTTRRR